MLRITPSTNAQGAKEYFDKSLALGDYYTLGQELPGVWHGKAAQMLGLAGEVSREEFHALADNRHPQTERRLTPGAKAKRRVGYDFTFSAKKSVSLAHALTGDERILEAFSQAVSDTMAEIEEGMETRVRKDGQNTDRITGNLVYGQFVHLTSRPVGGVPDPHMHAHCYVFNTTYDSIEHRWKAGQFGSLKRDAPYYQAAFDARLALSLEELGYRVERRAGGWELAGVSTVLARKFSRRTEEIEKVAAEKGIDEAKAKSHIGAWTREHKIEQLTASQLQQEWTGRLTIDEFQGLRTLRSQQPLKERQRYSAEKALQHALDHSFVSASVKSDKQVLAEALKVGVGETSVEDINTAFEADQSILSRKVGNQTLCTTRGVLAEEKQMIAFARAGRGACVPLSGVPWEIQDNALDDEQRAAVQHILSSTDRVVSVRGAAGVGKTRLMKEAVAALEHAGHKVHPFAPSAAASRGVLRADGFETADTVAQLLTKTEVQDQMEGGVIWVDEAGLLGAEDMNHIFQVAQSKNARVLLTGDTRQHASVSRGDALRTLQSHGCLKASEVTQIHRQQAATYKEAIAALSEGAIPEGFEALESMGAIQEFKDDDRYQILAKDFADAMGEGSVLAVSPTHAEGRKVTRAIRDELKMRGSVLLDERSFLRYQNLNLTEAQRVDHASYEAGQVVQFHQNAKKPSKQLSLKTSGGFSLAGAAHGVETRTVWRGYTRGEKLVVTGHDKKGRVIARDSNNHTVVVPVDQSGKYQVYRKTELDLSTGDLVRMTKNGTFLGGTTRFNNGATYKVKGFSQDGNIRLSNGCELHHDFGHLASGFTTTSHSSQGRTVDHVFIAQSAVSSPAATKEQFYVSASRGRKRLSIYTDDKDALIGAVKRSGERASATALLAPEPEKKGFAGYLQTHAVRVNRIAMQARERLLASVDKAQDLVLRYARPLTQSARGGGPREREHSI